MADQLRKLNEKADKGVLEMCPDAAYVIICNPGGKSEICLTSRAKEGKQVGDTLDIKHMKTLKPKSIVINSLTGSCYEFICDGGDYYVIEVPC